MSNAFDEMLKKLQATTSGGGDLAFFKPPHVSAATDTGAYLRVATPAYVESGTPPFFQYMQYDLRCILGTTKTIVAPYYFGAPDPIAEFREENAGSKDASIIAVVDGLTPKMKWGVLGVTKAEPGKISVWSGMPKTPLITMLAISKKSQGPDAEYAWPFDLEAGHDFEILLHGAKGTIPKYQVNVSPRSRPICENWEAMQEKIDNFDIWSKVLYIETKEILEGVLKGRYDKDEAKAARAARDEKFGRPYPEAPYNFMSNWGDESPAVETVKGSGTGKKATKAVEEDDLPFTPGTAKVGAATSSIREKMEAIKKKAAAKAGD